MTQSPAAPMTPSPHDAVRVLKVLEPLDVRLALVHLLTPRDVACNMQVKVSGSVVTFRGKSVDTAGMSWGQMADAIADLAMDVAELEDEFLDLRGAPAGLLKPVRSGAHTLLAGAELLFGSQCVLLPADADGDLVAAVSKVVASGERFAAGTRQLGGWDVMVLAAGQAVAVAVTGRTAAR